MRKKYLYLCGITLSLCIIILIYFKDNSLVRGFVGDSIFTVMLYFMLRAVFINIRTINIGMFIILITYGVEILQYYDITDKVGILNNNIGRIVFGATFDPKDLIAYTIGLVIAVLYDKKYITQMRRKTDEQR